MDTLRTPRPHIRSVVLLGLWLMTAALAANAWLSAFVQPSTSMQKLSERGTLVAASTPYTIVLQETTRGPSEAMTSQGKMTIALRRNGAIVIQYEHLGTPAVIQRTIELPNGVTLVVDDIRERRTSALNRLSASARARMDPSRQCVKNDLGEVVLAGQIISEHDVVAGYDAIRVQSGNSVHWFARQLGCAQIKTSTALSGGTVNEKTPILIAPGEPDTALFYVPERYIEVQPSVFHNLDPSSREAFRLDRFYFERRPPQ